MGIQATLMNGKAIGMAATVTMLALGTEAIFVPMAMNTSYDRSIESVMPMLSAPVEEAVQKAKPQERQRYIPLTPIKRHGPTQAVPVEGDQSPVS